MEHLSDNERLTHIHAEKRTEHRPPGHAKRAQANFGIVPKFVCFCGVRGWVLGLQPGKEVQRWP